MTAKLLPRLLITLGSLIPYCLALNPSESTQIGQPSSLEVELLGYAKFGSDCDQPVLTSTFYLSHDCSTSGEGKKLSIPVRTDDTGTFSTSLTIDENDDKKTPRFCSVVLCLDEGRAFCSNSIFEVKEKTPASVRFCFHQKSAGAPVVKRLSKRNAWSAEDLNWLKRSGGSKTKVFPGEGHRLAEDGRLKKSWEAAADELGWMKRNRISEMGKGEEMGLSSASAEAKRRWEEADLAWL